MRERHFAQGAWIDLLDFLAGFDVGIQTYRRGLVENVELVELFGPHWRRYPPLNTLADQGFIHVDPDGVWVHEHVQHQQLNARAEKSEQARRSIRSRWDKQAEADTNVSHHPDTDVPGKRDTNESLPEGTEVNRGKEPNSLPQGGAAREATFTPPTTDDPPTPIDHATGDKQLAVELATIVKTGLKLIATQPHQIAPRALRQIQRHPLMTPNDHKAVIRHAITHPWWDTDKAVTDGVILSDKCYDSAIETQAQEAHKTRKTGAESLTNRTLTPTERAYLERYGEPP